MAEEILEKEDPAIWAKFPWQKSMIVLLLAISTLSGWLYKRSVDDNDREKERVKNWSLSFKEKEREVIRLQDKLNDCQEGKTQFITDLFNNELALKLSKDTSATSKLIIKSLIKVNEQRKEQQK